MQHEKVTAVVLAAGKGSRMQSSLQKQYMDLNGYPVIYYALKCFQESVVDDIVLVTGEHEVAYCENEIVKRYGFDKVSQVIAGGRERYESVYQAISAVTDTDYIMIHDGARPFLTVEMIEISIDGVREHGACTVAVPVKDTIKEVAPNGFGVNTLDRSVLWSVQTPQTFSYSLIRKAYLKMMEHGDTCVTDDTMIVERYLGHSVKVIMGDYNNIKITTPEDMKVAEYLAFSNR